MGGHYPEWGEWQRPLGEQSGRQTGKGVRLMLYGDRAERTRGKFREDREENADPVTVAATSRTDRSREIFLFLRMPVSVLTHFASFLPVSSGSECMRFNLVERYINNTKRSRGMILTSSVPAETASCAHHPKK